MEIKEESSFVRHARAELDRAGLFDEDSDYGGMLGDAVMELIQIFSMQGHSGYSAITTLDLFERLVKYENLTPLTDDPDEWIDHTGTSGGTPTYQSARRPNAFSTDGGKTYYILDENPQVIHKSKPSVSE